MKSNWQLANEAAALMGIAQERAKERQSAQAKINSPFSSKVELVPPLSDTGKARDEVGEQLGVSGRTVSDLLFVKKEVDKLAQAGEADRVQELREHLNRNVKQTAQTIREQSRPKREPIRHEVFDDGWGEPPDDVPARDSDKQMLDELAGDEKAYDWTTDEAPLVLTPKPKRPFVSVAEWQAESASERAERLFAQHSSKHTFNQTNDNVEWARWTWNPVTGCLHGWGLAVF